MMILSHRGYWKTEGEKNSMLAFQRSFELGFGIETDIRDAHGEIVVSHDIPSENSPLLEEILRLYRKFPGDLPLALNIKSDGLQNELSVLLERHRIWNYFVFDMSIPQHLQYIKSGVPSFSRQSEYEREPLLYEFSAGVWLDCFESEWFDMDTLRRHLEREKRVCLVSPELHHRDPSPCWEKIRTSGISSHDRFMLCTDHPERARSYFDEQ